MANRRQVKKNLKRHGQVTRGKNGSTLSRRQLRHVEHFLRFGPHDAGTCSNDECVHVDHKVLVPSGTMPNPAYETPVVEARGW